MSSDSRYLLRLHLEAVWNIRLPPLVEDMHELLPSTSQPPWQLCLAALEGEAIAIWRPDGISNEKGALVAKAREALVSFPPKDPPPDVNCEVAHAFVALPALSLLAAQTVARSLTEQDRALLAAYEADSLAYYFDPVRAPLIGVVNEGRLLSLAHSSRRTDEACELGIETLAQARRRGFALAATVVWTYAVLGEGSIPLYSAFAWNSASLHLAAVAGYRPFARVVLLNG